jgi:hypothetical protein
MLGNVPSQGLRKIAVELRGRSGHADIRKGRAQGWVFIRAELDGDHVDRQRVICVVLDDDCHLTVPYYGQQFSEHSLSFVMEMSVAMGKEVGAIRPQGCVCFSALGGVGSLTE